MRITSKGQVTIPRAIREEFGLLPNTEVAFVLEDGALRIVKVEPDKTQEIRGQRALRLLRDQAHISMSTELISRCPRMRSWRSRGRKREGRPGASAMLSSTSPRKTLFGRSGLRRLSKGRRMSPSW